MKVPNHLAIIMDGNGRWAQARGRVRPYGHLKGTRTAKKIMTTCARLGIKYLTLFTFSTENWLRPKEEVTFLMLLLKRYLKKEIQNLMKENIRFKLIGDASRLPEEVQKVVHSTIEQTSQNSGMTLICAISYGGRQDILKASKALCEAIQKNKLSIESIDETIFSSFLDSSFCSDPDLVIRTSGEYRISNFMLWQMAYSELYFTNKLWPDFNNKDLYEAISYWNLRERRYGQLPYNTLPSEKINTQLNNYRK